MSKILSFRKEYVSYVAVLLFGLLVSAMAANAASTISTNISTGGTLAVTGASTLTGAVAVTGAINASSTLATSGNMTVVAGYGLDTAGAGVLNLGTTTATTVIVGSASAKVGVGATTTPLAALSVNTEAGSPGFVVGSTTATHFIVDKVGFVGVASSSPYTALAVTGTTTSSAGVRIGSAGSGVSQLLFGTCTVTFASITASSTQVSTCSATGVGLTDRVFVTPHISDNGIIFVSASSTAANVIQVALFNVGLSGAVNPADNTWSWMALR